MRHRVYGKHFSRDTNQRSALFKGLIRSLILHGSIVTTDIKAKAIKPSVDKLITSAKKNTQAGKTMVHSVLPHSDISKKLLEEIVPAFKDRTSGFTRIVKLGRRAGDGAMTVKMSLIEEGKIQSSVTSSQLSEKSQPVDGRSETENRITEKPKSENRKQKTDNKKTLKKEQK